VVLFSTVVEPGFRHAEQVAQNTALNIFNSIFMVVPLACL